MKENNRVPKELFHGGCHGCIAQEKYGVTRCVKCCFFDADWNLPDLSENPARDARNARKEEIRELARKAEVDMLARKKEIRKFAKENK